MNVIVLGCGPAGLLAALAAEQAGARVKILSTKVKSPTHGAMYLHRSIPGLTSETPDATLHITKRGERMGYALKVYGDQDAPVSWDKFETGPTDIWYLDRAYDALWERFEDRIVDTVLRPDTVSDLEAMRSDAVIISTVPADKLCHGASGFKETGCWFRSQKIYILKHRWCPADELHLVNHINIMAYSGQPSEQWYRHSDIRGLASWEFSGQVRPDIKGPDGAEWVEGIKPLRAACYCHPGILHVGRFGAWDKQQLVHHAYEQTKEVMKRAL